MKSEIRAEAERDRVAVREVNAAAFGRGEEARLVDLLRARAWPIVSLVAEEEGALVGHILFTPVSIGGHGGLFMGLAPMAVEPSRQRRGIGSALVCAGLEECGQLGALAVVVLGHSQYYPRFGFVAASRFGLACEYDVPPEVFMALEMETGALRGVSGMVKYHGAFAEAVP